MKLTTDTYTLKVTVGLVFAGLVLFGASFNDPLDERLSLHWLLKLLGDLHARLFFPRPRAIERFFPAVTAMDRLIGSFCRLKYSIDLPGARNVSVIFPEADRQTGEIVAGPELVTRGFVHVGESTELLDAEASSSKNSRRCGVRRMRTRDRLNPEGAGAVVGGAIAFAHFAQPIRSRATAAAGLVFAAYGVWLVGRPIFLFAIVAYAAALAVLVAIRLRVRPLDASGRLVLWGVAVSVVAAAIQQSGWSIHRYFNHNDLYHLIQVAAMLLLYRGARRLTDSVALG